MSRKRRAVVTGFGILAANGIGLKEFERTLLAAESGIGPITLFDASEFRTRIAGEIKGFNPTHWKLITNGKAKRAARHTQLALAATELALNHAGLSNGHSDCAEPIAVIVGVSTSGMDVLESEWHRLKEKGPGRVRPYGVSYSQPNAVVSAMVEVLRFRTRSQTMSTACQAGLDAIAAAAAMIRAGKAELALAGGVDAPITPLACAGFCSSGLLSARNECPEKASRPFDLHRDGGVIAEGAGIVVIEELTHALTRGAVPYAEVTGYGSSADTPGGSPGAGIAESMAMAIANAGLRAEHIDYVCAHGPSDPEIDRVETAMIKQVFGLKKAYRMPISSIKGVTGNPLSAAGPFELAACALAIREGLVPPTANQETPDPACDLDYVPNQPRRAAVLRTLLNVRGLGGSNGSLVVEKVVLP